MSGIKKEWENNFSKEEIESAIQVRDLLLKENDVDLLGIYMAGEIVMWAELNNKLPK